MKYCMERVFYFILDVDRIWKSYLYLYIITITMLPATMGAPSLIQYSGDLCHQIAIALLIFQLHNVKKNASANTMSTTNARGKFFEWQFLRFSCQCGWGQVLLVSSCVDVEEYCFRHYYFILPITKRRGKNLFPTHVVIFVRLLWLILLLMPNS